MARRACTRDQIACKPTATAPVRFRGCSFLVVSSPWVLLRISTPTGQAWVWYQAVALEEAGTCPPAPDSHSMHFIATYTSTRSRSLPESESAESAGSQP